MIRKVLFFYIAVFLIITECYSQKSGVDLENVVLSQNVEYDVIIKNKDLCGEVFSEELWYRNNLEASVRLPFLRLLFHNAMSGKLLITDTLNNIINTTQLESLLILGRDSFSITKLFSEDFTEYDSYPYPVPSCDDTALRFRENWTYNPKTMAITKKVLAVAPIVFIQHTNEYGEELSVERRVLFWIIFPEKNNPSKVLTKRFVSTATYKGRAALENANMDSAAIDSYMNKLMRMFYDDSLVGYEIDNELIINLPMSSDEWELRYCDSYNFNRKRSSPGTATYDSIIRKCLAVNSIRFLEEWTFDPLSMYMEKKVSGVCLVECVYTENNEFKGYKPKLWFYFGDVWMPFDEKLELKNPKY